MNTGSSNTVCWEFVPKRIAQIYATLYDEVSPSKAEEWSKLHIPAGIREETKLFIRKELEGRGYKVLSVE